MRTSAVIEALEPRQMLTAGAAAVGFETRVNTYTPGAQTNSAVATDTAGDYVVTWNSTGQDGNGYGVYAQRYNSSGTAQGSEFRVNTYTTGDQKVPVVAMDAAGDFVIAWSSNGQDGSSYGIYAQRYNSAGTAQGGEFKVNTYTTGGQNTPSVAMDSAGDFVIAWASVQDGSTYGIYAQRYNSAGTAQGGEFKVNTYTTSLQYNPSVAMDSAGDFVVTWQSYKQDATPGYGVYAQRYNSAGSAQGGEFKVNTYTTNSQYFPSVAMDSAGDFVITWQSTGEDGSGDGIYAQQYNSAGAVQGVEFKVNTYTTNDQSAPAISMDSAGDFLVTWHSNLEDGGSGTGVFGQRYNAAAAAQGSEFQVNTFTAGNQGTPSVAMDSAGDFVIAWQSNLQDGSGYGVYAQRYVATVGPIITAVLEGSGAFQVLTGDELDSAITSFSINFSDNMNVVPGGTNSVINPSNWTLIRYGIDVSNQISGITFGFNASTNRYVAVVSFTPTLTDGGYQLIARQTIQDATARGLDGEADKVAGGDFAINFYVASTQKSGSETRVNTYTTGDQYGPSPAMDAAGDYVISWDSNNGTDGSSYGVYAQRYNSAGVAQGVQFQVNTYTTGGQFYNAIAMDAAGDFVITWVNNGQDTNGDIYAQRYNSSGTAQGGEFLVNTYTTGTQTHAKVAMDSAGDFVITWQSNGQDGGGYGVYAKRYNAAGVVQGAEFPVNTYTTGAQQLPSAAMDSAGDFVISWESAAQDGSSYGVYAQRYNSSGTAQGSEFRVNTYTTGFQRIPSSAMDSAGDFVISWESVQDGSGYGIYSQRYNAAGVVQGAEFLVNTYTTGAQQSPSVAMDSAGDFAISWESVTQDSGTAGVYAQRYNNAGVAQGSEFQVNTYTTSTQSAPSVAMDAKGDLVIAWQSSGQDGNGYGDYAQRYNADVAPWLYQIETTSLVAAAPLTTPITASLLVFDADSNYWTGATVQIAINYRSAEDVLGFINTNTPGITGAWNSSTGTLTLSGTDTLSNYRTALQNVTYHDTSGTPNTALTRTINFQATDGLLKSNLITRSLTVQASSTPAVLSGVSGTGLYGEGDPALALAGGLVITDPSTVYLTSATVAFTNWQGEDRLTFNNVFALPWTFTQNLVNNTANFTITGTDFVDHYQTLLRSVVYWDVSPSPITSPRVASFTVSDGLSNSNAVTRSTITAAVNQAPTLTSIETTPLACKANDPTSPQPISNTLLAGDPDSNNLSKATVQITSGYENDANGTDVLSFVNQNGITGSWNATNGTLTLTGDIYVGFYRVALRSVTFSTSGTNVSTANRTLSIIATDDYSPTTATSLTATRTVTVSAATTNVPPTLGGIPSSSLAYVRNATAIAVASAAYVYDPDSVNLASMTIQITSNYQNGLDVLAATTVTGITSSFNASTGLLTLSGVASLASYQTVLQSVTFHTTSGANTSTRTLIFIPNDGLASGTAATRNITLS